MKGPKRRVDSCSTCTRGRYKHTGFAPVDQRPVFTCTACGDTITKGHAGGDLADLVSPQNRPESH